MVIFNIIRVFPTFSPKYYIFHVNIINNLLTLGIMNIYHKNDNKKNTLCSVLFLCTYVFSYYDDLMTKYVFLILTQITNKSLRKTEIKQKYTHL